MSTNKNLLQTIMILYPARASSVKDKLLESKVQPFSEQCKLQCWLSQSNVLLSELDKSALPLAREKCIFPTEFITVVLLNFITISKPTSLATVFEHSWTGYFILYTVVSRPGQSQGLLLNIPHIYCLNHCIDCFKSYKHAKC